MLLLLPQTHTQTHTDTHTRTRTKHVREALSVHMWVFKEKNFSYRSILENGSNGENVIRIDYRVWVYSL